MSTRGAIGRPTPSGGWQGRYHHFDAYPTGLGRELFQLYHHTFDRDHEQMARVLIDEHPAGWSTFIVGPGAEGPFTTEHFAHSGFQSFDDPLHGQYPQCYCHGQRSESRTALVCRCDSEPNGSPCDPLFIEWAYAITGQGLQVFTSVHPEAPGQAYRHRLIADVAWNRAAAPAWDRIEQRAHLVHIPDLTV